MQFFKSTLLVAVAFAATLIVASPTPADCPWQDYALPCLYDSDCVCLGKCIADVSTFKPPNI